jgi:copper(I)-binding protein
MKEATTVTRWTRRLLVGAIAMLVPALAGCEAGLNAPTLEYHPASNGVSIVANGIAIDNAFVLGPPLNTTLPVGGQAGVFLSLSAQDGNDRLVSASAPGAAGSVQLINGPVTLVQGTVVDLSGPTPEVVMTGLTSPLSGGQTVNLVLTFSTAGVVALEIPVEPAAYEYTTFSPPAPAPGSPSASTAAHRHKARTRVRATADLSASASPSATP